MNLPFFRKQQTLFAATGSERREAVERLIAQGTFGSGYHLFLLLATLIVTTGLLMSNTPVVIGGMVLAPLLIPILSLSVGIVSLHPKSLLRASVIFIASVGLVVGVAWLTTILIAEVAPATNWIPETIRVDLYAFIAFCSGIAGAFAWVKEDVSPAMPGVAISISLLPPLCTVGIAVALGRPELFISAGKIFIANVAGILLASILVFLFLGLSHEKKSEERAITKATAS